MLTSVSGIPKNLVAEIVFGELADGPHMRSKRVKVM